MVIYLIGINHFGIIFNQTNQTFIINEIHYYFLLYNFVTNTTNGLQYANTIQWNNNSNLSKGILGSYMIGQFNQDYIINSNKQVNTMYDIRNDCNKILDNNKLFPFTFTMLFSEQYAVIYRGLWRNLLIALCVIFFIILTLIPNIIGSILVLFCVVATIINVFGFMWLWGLIINAVTVLFNLKNYIL